MVPFLKTRVTRDLEILLTLYMYGWKVLGKFVTETSLSIDVHHCSLVINEDFGVRLLDWPNLRFSFSSRTLSGRTSRFVFRSDEAPMLRCSRRVSLWFRMKRIYADASATVGFTVCDPLSLINDDVRRVIPLHSGQNTPCVFSHPAPAAAAVPLFPLPFAFTTFQILRNSHSYSLIYVHAKYSRLII